MSELDEAATLAEGIETDTAVATQRLWCAYLEGVGTVDMLTTQDVCMMQVLAAMAAYGFGDADGEALIAMALWIGTSAKADKEEEEAIAAEIAAMSAERETIQ